MRGLFLLIGLFLCYMVFSVASYSVQGNMQLSTMPAALAGEAGEAPKPSASEKTEGTKAKAEKTRGDVGLMDLEKNYMILVTKEGKLITLDFDEKTKVTVLEAKPVKMGDVGLGSSAEVEYQTKGDKQIVTKIEYRPAKGGE